MAGLKVRFLRDTKQCPSLNIESEVPTLPAPRSLSCYPRANSRGNSLDLWGIEYVKTITRSWIFLPRELSSFLMELEGVGLEIFFHFNQNSHPHIELSAYHFGRNLPRNIFFAEIKRLNISLFLFSLLLKKR